MKILQIVPAISQVYGGPSQMVQGVSAALARAGVDVTVLTTDANGDVGQARLHVPLEVPVRQDGYRIYYFRCAPFRRYKFSIRLLQWLQQRAQEYDLAHIHALFSPVSSAAARVARQQGLPYVLRPLGTLDPADLAKKKYLKWLYALVLERSNLAGAAALHFTSEQEAKVSQRFGVITQDWVLPLGVSLAPAGEANVRQQWGLAQDVPIVLFMSRLAPKKGLDLLIPALERLLAEGQRFYFVLAGANPQDPGYEHRIYQQLAHSPLAAWTHCVGFVSGSLKTAWLEAADLFVLPSYYENFGIAVAEAMAVGTPVVVSDQVHIWQEIEQAQAGWICRCQVESLTDRLRAALQDPLERRQRGQQAQAQARKHYSWDAIAQQLVVAYERIATTDCSH
jgi:glycosyltransferase involved in cell wall biosynthesis